MQNTVDEMAEPDQQAVLSLLKECSLESVRILDGYGRLIWRSHATEKNDRENE